MSHRHGRTEHLDGFPAVATPADSEEGGRGAEVASVASRGPPVMTRDGSRAMLQRSRFRERSHLLAVTIRGLDALAVTVAGAAAYVATTGSWSVSPHYQIALLLGALLTLVGFAALGVYHAWHGLSIWSQTRQVLLAWALVGAALMVVGVATKTNIYFSRRWMAVWLLFGGLLLVAARVGMGAALRGMRKRGWNLRRIVLVGAGAQAEEVARHLGRAPWAGLEIQALFHDDRRFPAARFECAPVYPLAHLVQFVERQKVDEVWLTLPAGAEDGISKIVHQLRYSTVSIRYVPGIQDLRLLNPSVSEIAGMVVLDLHATPFQGVNRIVKAMEDWVLAAVILLLISPLLLAIALGVKLSSPGPVLFKQRRNGCDGKPIKVYKFRTMVVHREADGVVTQATCDDSRVTPFGAFLRRTSLDELPQFFNVLQGHMSIVGPRPHALEHNEYYKHRVESYMWRHRVKPGITGWAQVHGYRGATDTLDKMESRVEHDLWYIDNWSLWLDLKIIVLTLFRVLGDRNAY